MTSVVLIWDLLLVTLIALPSVQRRLSAVVWRVERTAGGVLMAFGCWIVWQFILINIVNDLLRQSLVIFYKNKRGSILSFF